VPQVTAAGFTYYDLRRRTKSDDISVLFPGWQGENERILVLSPHDDDGILGAGYALLAALENGAQPHVAIFCDGWAGYSRPEDAGTIVEQRRQETVAAYRALGLPEANIHRFDFPDFSAWPWLGWHLPAGQKGTTARVLPVLRRLKPTRLLVPNGYREHIDHEATFRVGAYDGPQVGDAILAEYGFAEPIRSYLQYAVWGDFPPEDALLSDAAVDLRANRAIVAPPEVEGHIGQAVARFESQQQVIAGILEARRRNRVRGRRALELYLAFDPRPPLEYGPYHRLVEEIG
jgi:hypothetical protein